MKLHYIMHAFSDGNDEGEELREIPKVFRVQYWPFDEEHWPRDMVVARYELVEVVEGELPPKNRSSEFAQNIAAEAMKKFF